MHYIYINTCGSNEFEGSQNQILARREAEQQFGYDGRLFQEVQSGGREKTLEDQPTPHGDWGLFTD